MTTRQNILLAMLILGGKSTYLRILSFLPPDYKTANYYGLLARMEADRLVARRGGLVIMKPLGLAAMSARLGPRLRALAASRLRRGAPPEAGRLIIYDFPTDRAYLRSRLQAFLTRLGCVPLRDGVYATAYDVGELVARWAEAHDVLPRIWCVRVPIGDGTSAGGLLHRAWDGSELAERYRRLLDRLAIVRGIQIPEKKKSGMRRIRHDFIKIVAADPLLPAALLPPDWPFDRVREQVAGEGD